MKKYYYIPVQIERDTMEDSVDIIANYVLKKFHFRKKSIRKDTYIGFRKYILDLIDEQIAEKIYLEILRLDKLDRLEKF